MNDLPVRNSQEAFMMEMRAAKMVRTVTALSHSCEHAQECRHIYSLKLKSHSSIFRFRSWKDCCDAKGKFGMQFVSFFFAYPF